ncbi:hypothetical protein GCM10008090_21410 [Arenicella chitinivorans]|uniref:Methyltransferase domain-containing protein n=1 Tax=Arenicella chitinivorans TaxID=1329800 RepID=A0A918RVC1_9GAMM|nr:class I SAM-dependent methyltransferase [Arenicella chitinivorans]GHA11366.1 hypothetical protein GCM10008090_21410 [Arenicella chitinivorans]
MTTDNSTQQISSWDTFWQNSDSAHAFSDSGANHPSIQTYWYTFFSELVNKPMPLQLLDLASGHGALIDMLRNSPQSEQIAVTCLDSSEAAIQHIGERFTDVKTVLGDAADTQFDDGQFDVVLSQFGIEYAGQRAFDEAVRTLAPQGTLRVLLHYTGGSIAGECRRNLALLTTLKESRFLPLAQAFFNAGFAAADGNDRRAYDQAGADLQPAMRSIENAVQQGGDLVAADFLEHLYLTTGKIHASFLNYDASELNNWLDAMQREADAYSVRMQSMLDAAIDEAQFHRLCERLHGQGLTLQQAGPLMPNDTNRPLAWALTAVKN